MNSEGLEREVEEQEADDVDRALTSRAGWLRAAVLGADDGIVSTAALIVGVAASNASPQVLLTAGLAGLVAGAMSMAAGEYVSVSSQRDLEDSLRHREKRLEAAYPEVAMTELAVTMQLHGIDPGLARLVAQQISRADPVGATLRVRYGITEMTKARPLQAALASAASFSVGAVVPLLGLLAPTSEQRIVLAVVFALVALAASGTLAADVGGAPRGRAALRVVLGGGLAMAISALVGLVVGVAA